MSTSMTPLERGYRRLVACYPRSFRKENAEEILSVLLATAGEGQQRPSLAESLDLLKGAVRMHLGLSRAPRAVLAGVRLMYLGAATQLAVVITILVTAGSIRTAALHRYPQYAAAVNSAVHFDVTLDLVLLPIAVVVWLAVAWGCGRGSPFGRLAAIMLVSLYTLFMVLHLAEGHAALAPAAMIASGVEWLLGVAAVACILRKQSWSYYEQLAARPQEVPL